jgi:transcriptional regulator with PAS, ATPase and Fis domain
MSEVIGNPAFKEKYQATEVQKQSDAIPFSSYKAEHRITKRKCYLKVLKKLSDEDSENINYLKKEAEEQVFLYIATKMSTLGQHEHIETVWDVVESPEGNYIDLEWFDGDYYFNPYNQNGSRKKKSLASSKSSEQREFLNDMVLFAKALAFAHEENFPHGSLMWRYFFKRKTGERSTAPVLAGFGHAASYSEKKVSGKSTPERCEAEYLISTKGVGYLSKEQLSFPDKCQQAQEQGRGSYIVTNSGFKYKPTTDNQKVWDLFIKGKKQSDIWAFGATMYHFLTCETIHDCKDDFTEAVKSLELESAVNAEKYFMDNISRLVAGKAGAPKVIESILKYIDSDGNLILESNNTFLDIVRAKLEQLEANGQITKRVTEIILKCIELEVKDRYQTIGDLCSDLEEASHNLEKLKYIWGGTPYMKEIKKNMQKFSQVKDHVLIIGESGTGKENIARMLHEQSPRRDKKYLTLNCAAISENLFESELFGHMEGAFTGADKEKMGKFEAADGGTLFLDEIGELPFHTQAKLLRTLESGEIQKVGRDESKIVDVRVVAATNKNLGALAYGKGSQFANQFRKDLYERLNVLSIEMPTLKERKDDIREFIEKFFDNKIKEKAGGENIGPEKISAAAYKRLEEYHWPGNIRQLQSEITRAFVLAEKGSTLEPDDFLLPERIDFCERAEELASGFEQLAIDIQQLKNENITDKVKHWEKIQKLFNQNKSSFGKYLNYLKEEKKQNNCDHAIEFGLVSLKEDYTELTKSKREKGVDNPPFSTGAFIGWMDKNYNKWKTEEKKNKESV